MNAEARQPEPHAIPTGAHLVTQRRGYAHHGLYIGHGKVIHYAGFCTALRSGPVEETTLERFAAGHAVTVKPAPWACYLGHEAVSRAKARLGEDNYRLLTNNCEHFVSWCLTGCARSEQVEACLRHPVVAARALASLLRTLAGRWWRRLDPALAIA